MPVKDHTQHFSGLRTAPVNPVSNTVSRGMSTGDRSFSGVVCESGKPILDAEVNLRQEALWMQGFLRSRWETPSGWLRGSAPVDRSADFHPGIAINDDTPSGTHVHGDGSFINALPYLKREALVAGYPVVVEYTNTVTDGANLIVLEEPTIYDGTNATVKRTDFMFLEVWRALVAPSVKAEGFIQVDDASLIDTAGPDVVTIDGLNLSAVAVGPPGVDQYVVDPASEVNTATNIANAINDPGNSFAASVSARALGARVLLKASAPGLSGNAITLSVTVLVPGTIVVSGPFLSGGETRPNKPADGYLYRHGNVNSPLGTWLADEINDPVFDKESSQRIQVQYRIRVTGAAEGVNHKLHPDGFSQNAAGAPTILARGAQAAPVGGVSVRPCEHV
jgi:hypothetical protein